MTAQKPFSPKEEVAQRGEKIYQTRVRPQVEEGNLGKYVAIDIDTGDFEVADDTMAATKQLRSRLPDSQIWMVRIGYRTVHQFGARSLKEKV